MSPLYNLSPYFQIDSNTINPAAVLSQAPPKEMEQPHEATLPFADAEKMVMIKTMMSQANAIPESKHQTMRIR